MAGKWAIKIGSFRDENLVTSFMVDTGDGPDPNSFYSILNRGKRHDIFTVFAVAAEGAIG